MESGRAPAGQTSFTVANDGQITMNWTAQVVEGTDWATISSGASGINAGTITVDFTQNTSTTVGRTAVIRVVMNGDADSAVDVTVVQAANTLLPGDCDSNGIVNFDDYLTLKANFGKTGGVSAAEIAQFKAAAQSFEAGQPVEEQTAAEAQDAVQQTLPCGFLGVALMSVLGLALYSLTSLREQE